MPRKERFLGNCEVFCFLRGRGLAGGTLVSAAVMREGHRSEWQSTKGGVVVGGPLQCWEAGVCLQTPPPWLRDGERWGLGGLTLALVGVVQPLGCCCLCTAESRLAPPAWADAEAVRCPKEGGEPGSRSPHRRGERAGQRRAGGAAPCTPGGTTSSQTGDSLPAHSISAVVPNRTPQVHGQGQPGAQGRHHPLLSGRDAHNSAKK